MKPSGCRRLLRERLFRQDLLRESLLVGCAGLTMLGADACRGEKFIHGVVLDYDSRTPITGAAVVAGQSGWGMSSTGLVWDKSYKTVATTDGAGRFTLPYRVGSSANVSVEQPGYSRFYQWYAPNADVTVRLRRLATVPRTSRDGMLHLGLFTSGRTYGWSFADRATAESCTTADVLPVRIGRGERDPIVLRACGQGGVRYIPAESLGVDNLYLVYTDSVLESSYTSEVTLDFASRGGVVFVRTRDGAHYAKVEFQPASVASEQRPDLARDLMLHYVYDSSGSRAVIYVVPPLDVDTRRPPP